MHTPNWFKDDEVLVVNAKTCGINKDGKEQYLVDEQTGFRTLDIDDKLAECCDDISSGKYDRSEIFYTELKNMEEFDVYVPKYYDYHSLENLQDIVKNSGDLTLKTIGELIEQGMIRKINGHGSPSSDQRLGIIPYIKVSDLRAGQVNINPTNMVPLELAQDKKFWNGETSGLKAYDLISPERASKNIGEFCVLMPGQEQVLLTKEVIVLRAAENDLFDQFYLMWALSLKEVKEQWDRVILMQTNREDVGNRFLDITLPVPISNKAAKKYAEPFETFYMSLEKARNDFIGKIENSKFQHHIFLKSSSGIDYDE